METKAPEEEIDVADDDITAGKYTNQLHPLSGVLFLKICCICNSFKSDAGKGSLVHENRFHTDG